MNRIQKRRKERRKKRLSIFMPILVIFLMIGAYGSYLTFKLATAATETNMELTRGDKSEKRMEPIDPRHDNFSVLFLGIDALDGNMTGRTDAMLLATFNKSDRSIKMVSIPRDSRVPIVGLSREDKINHAHAFGGVDMAISTVEELFNIPVDYFVKLNFHAFIEIIDSLGGVEVDVPFSFYAHGSQGSRNAMTLNEGVQRLNGEEALAYVRMRKDDPRGDIGRGERQQEVVKSIIREAASLSSIMKYDNIIDNVGEHLATNFIFENILALHPYSKSLSEIETLRLKGDDARLNGIYYYIVDDESLLEVSTELQHHLEYR